MPDNLDEFVCIHELDASTCSICLAPTKAVGHSYPSSHSIVAKHDGYCPGCEMPIYAGEEIYNDGTGWCHVGC